MPAGARPRRADAVEADLLTLLPSLADSEGRLPSEMEMAERFQVSRVTLREALSALERKGLILRKQGSGTFLNQPVLEIRTRLDESVEYSRLIQSAGFQPAVDILDASILASTPAQQGVFHNPGGRVLSLRKLFYADAFPVVYCINTIPLALLKTEPPGDFLQHIDPAESLYAVLECHFQQTVAYQIAEVEAAGADAELAARLGCARGEPLLCIKEIGYNASQEAVFLGEGYYKPGKMHFQVLRRPG